MSFTYPKQAVVVSEFRPQLQQALPARKWFSRAQALAALSVLLLVLLVSVAGLKPWQHASLLLNQLLAEERVREAAVWLPDYQVDIDARPIPGLHSDVSGLTYDPDRRSLFAITNARPEIVELSLAGELLRRIPLSGLIDPEAIEYLSPGRYVVTDERRQSLVEIRIDDATTHIDASTARQVAIGIGRNGNKGFEGLAYDRRGQRLFVAKERDPQRIYEVAGFASPAQGGGASLEISDNPARDAALPGSDLSSLYFDEASGHLLALSDESRLVVELDRDGRPLSSLSLRAGRHGLQDSVPQAEGMAMDDRGNLYIVSEPNLFYRFSRPDAGRSD